MNYRVEDRENKQCRLNVNRDKDLVPLNIDESVMGHKIYMTNRVDICISCIKRHD